MLKCLAVRSDCAVRFPITQPPQFLFAVPNLFKARSVTTKTEDQILLWLRMIRCLITKQVLNLISTEAEGVTIWLVPFEDKFGTDGIC